MNCRLLQFAACYDLSLIMNCRLKAIMVPRGSSQFKNITFIAKKELCSTRKLNLECGETSKTDFACIDRLVFH